MRQTSTEGLSREHPDGTGTRCRACLAKQRCRGARERARAAARRRARRRAQCSRVHRSYCSRLALAASERAFAGTLPPITAGLRRERRERHARGARGGGAELTKERKLPPAGTWRAPLSPVSCRCRAARAASRSLAPTYDARAPSGQSGACRARGVCVCLQARRIRVCSSVSSAFSLTFIR